MDLNLTDVRNRLVIDAGGRVLGRVHDLEFDSNTWAITAVIVRLEREAAEQLNRYSVFHPADLAIRTEHIHRLADSVLLRTSLEELQHLLGIGPNSAAPPY